MLATSVLNETDIYREVSPPTALRGAIACFWLRRGDGLPVRVLPDACVDIVWRSGQDALVAGPDTSAWLSHTSPGELLVGARLLPGAGGPALGLPLIELRDQRVPLSELKLDHDRRLRNDADPDEAFDLLVGMTVALVGERPPDKSVQAGVSRLLEPAQRVDHLARELGFSERQLRRRFHGAVGYGPKTLQRVLRLRRFITCAGAAGSDGNMAAAAFEAGYADQAHLIRECRALTGLGPRRLIDRGDWKPNRSVR